MIAPIVAGILFSLLAVILGLLRPHAYRIFLGIFFLVMGIGVNLIFLITQPEFVYVYGRESWLPLYRTLTERIIGASPGGFGIALIMVEVLMGAFLLSRGVWVKIGLIGTMAFVLALVPISPAQIAWVGPVVANGYLLTLRFDTGVVGLIRTRRRRKRMS
jgi:hypothetical protein